MKFYYVYMLKCSDGSFIRGSLPGCRNELVRITRGKIKQPTLLLGDG